MPVVGHRRRPTILCAAWMRSCVLTLKIIMTWPFAAARSVFYWRAHCNCKAIASPSSRLDRYADGSRIGTHRRRSLKLSWLLAYWHAMSSPRWRH